MSDQNVNDYTASGRNAALIIFEPKSGARTWSIIDNGSKNGPAVNKKLVSGRRVLEPFDVIRIANTTLIFTGSEIIYNGGKGKKKFSPRKRQTIMSVKLNEVSVSGNTSPIKNLFGFGRSKTPYSKVLLRNIVLDIEAGDFILVLGGAGALSFFGVNKLLFLPDKNCLRDEATRDCWR